MTDFPQRRDPVIEEFQARRRAFQGKWNRIMLLAAFPAFAVFLLGMLVGGTVGMGVAFVGLALFATAMIRGVSSMREARACPTCGWVQNFALHRPYRICSQCGTRLSYGVKDSL